MVALVLCACGADKQLAGDERTCAAMAHLVDALGAPKPDLDSLLRAFRPAADEAHETDLQQAVQRFLLVADDVIAQPTAADANTKLSTSIFTVANTCDILGYPLTAKKKG